MKYVCLCYDEEKVLQAMPQSEFQDMMKNVHAYVDELRNSGRLIDAQQLQSVTRATTVRVRNGRTSITDGPFAETKEQLGGFFFIEARDLDEAVQIAAKLPGASLGCIEIRPVGSPRVDETSNSASNTQH